MNSDEYEALKLIKIFHCFVLQYLRDQTDMLVVGVIGLQGSGKSTVMSLLSANTPEEDQR